MLQFDSVLDVMLVIHICTQFARGSSEYSDLFKVVKFNLNVAHYPVVVIINTGLKKLYAKFLDMFKICLYTFRA